MTTFEYEAPELALADCERLDEWSGYVPQDEWTIEDTDLLERIREPIEAYNEAQEVQVIELAERAV